MSKQQNTLKKVLDPRRHRNVRFRSLCSLLSWLGFEHRIRGGHHVFYRDGIDEILNLQPRPDGSAKPYQVRQVREILMKCGLGEDSDGT